MPYTSEHKAATRAKILESARRLFNRKGFEQVSIDQVMTGAGLTRGGFYHHFSTKDELFAETVSSFTKCNPFRAALKEMPPQGAAELARTLIDQYLCDEVLENVEYHCPLYALPGDVARGGLLPQRAYTDLIRNLTNIYKNALAGVPDGEQRAQTIVSLCVGGMVLARTTDDAALKVSLRAAARQQALALLEGA
jgi:TetR/AcrR family transcriptional repressor of nem operon